MSDAAKVRVDWFLADALVVEVEISEETKVQLVAQAEMYIRTNGQLPWEKWSLLSDASRAVFLEAAERAKVLA